MDKLRLSSLCVFLLGVFISHADPPTFDVIYPVGAERGSTNQVTVSGKFDPWPPKVWIEGSDLIFNAETNKGKFSVVVATNALPGPRLLRLYNDEGASEVRLFVVGSGHEISEAETNNHFAKPQWISELPVTVNGRLDKRGDVDSFAVRVRNGEWLEARVDSYTLLSKLDAVLRLVLTNGQQITWNHDYINFDPRILWRATNDQLVVLQIFGFPYPADSDIRLTGGESAFYRLHLRHFKERPNEGEPPTEKEPNNRLEEAGQLELPAMVVGTIEKAGDEDRFRVVVNKNDYLEAGVEAAVFGSPLDAWLKIEDAAGKQLAKNDFEAARDPRLEWKVPGNGTFTVVVGSLTQRGGEDYRYRLMVRKVEPDFRATLASSFVALNSGATNDVKINFKRLRGHTNEVTVSVRDLPPGLTALSTNLPGKDGSLSLPLIATTNAAPFQGPIQVVLMDHGTQQEREVPFELTSRTENNGVPGGYTELMIERTDRFWLTVRPMKVETKKEEKK